jgi:hypothetical protein
MSNFRAIDRRKFAGFERAPHGDDGLERAGKHTGEARDADETTASDRAAAIVKKREFSARRMCAARRSRRA